MERILTEKAVVAVGFEPTKLTQWNLSPPPLTARAHNQNGNLRLAEARLGSEAPLTVGSLQIMFHITRTGYPLQIIHIIVCLIKIYMIYF